MKARWFVGAAVLGLGLAVAPVEAQVFTPTFQSPRAGSDIGVYISDGDVGDLGIEGILRQRSGTLNLGLRAGFLDAGDGLLTLGAELASPLRMNTAPVSLALTGAVQGLIGDVDGFGVQGGVSIGHTFRGAEVAITPYVHPRLTLTKISKLDAELDFLADVGFDLDFAANWSLRFGATLGDFDAVGIGLAWRR